MVLRDGVRCEKGHFMVRKWSVKLLRDVNYGQVKQMVGDVRQVDRAVATVWNRVLRLV